MFLKDHQAAVPTVLEHQGCGKVGDRLRDYGPDPGGMTVARMWVVAEGAGIGLGIWI